MGKMGLEGKISNGPHNLTSTTFDCSFFLFWRGQTRSFQYVLIAKHKNLTSKKDSNKEIQQYLNAAFQHRTFNKKNEAMIIIY